LTYANRLATLPGMDSTNVRPALLTARETAEILGCSVFTIARLAQRGDLRTALKGDGVRGARWFDPADIDAFKQQREPVQ
jgi:hypothetical protein